MEDLRATLGSGSGAPSPSPGPGSRRRSGQDVEGEEEDEESSSSSTEVSTKEDQDETLEHFRKQWQAELRKIDANVSEGNLNANSALNLVTASAASLSNPYPNPTSMAGAVSMAKAKEDQAKVHHQPHPFASAGIGLVDGRSSTQCQSISSHGVAPVVDATPAEVPTTGSVEEQARRWFLQGVGFERHGDLYDAVRCYRKAIQLDPDVEYKISQGLVEDEVGGLQDSLDSEDESDDDDREEENEDGGVEEEPVLVRRFLKQIEQRGWSFFIKAKETEKPHLNDIPVEVVSYILRWVVSSELDLRSLEVLSFVNKGFFCIARDDKLWQMACERVWAGCVLDSSAYDSYRDMFLQRSRVRFDGVYISKITYIRPGEHSFQDQSYRPWHFVEYYRYLRFFPDGKALFLTTSDEPSIIVPGLKERTPRNQAVLKGTYELYGSNLVSAVIHKPDPSSGAGKGKRHEIQQDTSFHIELTISNTRGRHNWMLKWTHHAVFIKKTILPIGRSRQNQNPTSTITSTAFELSPNKYPPMLFSRVKSYNTKSESILK